MLAAFEAGSSRLTHLHLPDSNRLAPGMRADPALSEAHRLEQPLFWPATT